MPPQTHLFRCHVRSWPSIPTKHSNLTRYPLENIRLPTLIISAADDLYGTYESSFYAAEEIAGATFAGFATGGHLLIGHEGEVRLEITNFLKYHHDAGQGTAMAV